MANLCYVAGDVVFTEPAAVARVLKDFSDTRWDEYVCLGDDSGYLYSAVWRKSDADTTGCTVVFSGDVNWALEGYEAYEFLQKMKTYGEVRSMNIEYSELSMDVFGHYDYTPDTGLTDTYLPFGYAPEYPEFASAQEEDEFFDSGDNYRMYGVALEEHGKTETITEESAKEQRRSLHGD